MNILNKLTLKNLRMNKSRTVVTIIGVILSAALITVVAGMVTSFQQTFVDLEINSSGNYELRLDGAEKDDIKDVKANRNVDGVYVKDTVGFAYVPEAKSESKPYYVVTALSADAFTDCFNMPLKEGRYPQNSNEIVLSEEAVKGSEKAFKVGDTLKLEVGDRMSDDGWVVPEDFGYGEYSAKYDENGNVISYGEETINVKSTKSYKIVGIMDECYSNDVVTYDYNACLSVFTLADTNALSKDAQLFVDFNENGEKNYIKTTAQITGLSEELTQKYFDNGGLDETDGKEREKTCKYEYIEFNRNLLRYKGYALGDSTITMLYSLGIIIIVIIIIASVFVIRNSFAISITEKIRLYGMLSSVGATSKQIKRNVLFEAFILAIIGIPLGVLLGALVVNLLVVIMNLLLADFLNGVIFTANVPWFSIVAAIALSAVTIVLSALGSAVRASRVSPITAIRSNKDIKISGKKSEKAYKTPKYISKIFGVGGSIAHKNLKRSKKKYRTTVLSIIVSVALFITISTFTQYMSKTTGEFYQEINYNLIVGGLSR